MGLREDIQRLYRENPNISGEEIRIRLSKESTPGFWKTLNQEQVKIRGAYPARRKNRNKERHPSKGIVRFIPPKE